MEQELLALRRELKKYEEYGSTSQVFDVHLKIRTIGNKHIINETKGHIYYADVEEAEIPELLRRDLKQIHYQVINVQQIKTCTLLTFK